MIATENASVEPQLSRGGLHHIVVCDDNRCHGCPLDDVAICGTDVSSLPFADDVLPGEQMCVVCEDLD